MKKRLVFTSFFLILLVSCASTRLMKTLTPEGEKVVFYKEKPKGCETLDKIIVSVGAKTEEERDTYLDNYFRNVTAEMGGNGYRLNSLGQIHHSGYTISFGYKYYRGEAYAYKCVK